MMKQKRTVFASLYKRVIGLFGILALVPAFALANPPSEKGGNGSVPDRILVAPEAELPDAAWAAILGAHGLNEERQIPQIGVRVLNVPAERRDKILEALARNPRIDFAEEDPEVQIVMESDDPHYPDQWHLPRIASPAAWDSTTGRADQVIAVIDTGVRSDHPDLKGKILPGYNTLSNNTDFEDDNGHGTMVAGAAAAIGNNREGVAGVAWENWILPVKSLDSSGGGSHSTIADGIVYATDNGARIINLSVGSPSSSRTLQRAVSYAWKNNSLLVAAAGNSGDDSPVYPAAYDQVIGVSALDQNDKLPSWATYGDHVSLSAPGVSILTTNRNGSYSFGSGSSFASPLVGGTAGLVLAVNPALDNSEVREILETTADDIGDVRYYGAGRVNAEAAVAVASGAPIEDTAPPTVTIAAPEDGATVSETVEIHVDAYDDVAVEKVELYLDDKLFVQGGQQLLTVAWDTTSVADGEHTLVARAYDGAGNTTVSDTVGVTVANESDSSAGEEDSGDGDVSPPEVRITSPIDGERVSKMTHVLAEAEGEATIVLWELYVNGELAGTDKDTSSARFNWNTNREAKGEYQLQAFAHDEAGNVSESPVVTVHK